MADEYRNALSKGYEIEGYQIVSVLGSGGFGITYRALEIEIGRNVAIKEYLPTGLATRDSKGQSVEPLSDSDRQGFKFGLESFHQEAKTLVSFRHPNIVSVLRYFSGNGTAYLVMEYEAGESLSAILARHKFLSEDEIRDILFPLLDGLEKVHEAGFLHRDIKPGNIYIRKDGSPVLLDFGSARHALGQKSKSLTTIVTRGYAPFEQYASRGNQGPWSDIYALGAVLYRAVTGHRPPDSPDRLVEDNLVATGIAAQDRCSDNLLSAIDSALLIEPNSRPQSVAAWRSMLNAAKPAQSLTDDTQSKAVAVSPAPPAPTPPVDPQKAPTSRGRGWIAGLLSAAVVFAIVGGGIWGWSKYQAARSREGELSAALAANAKADAARKVRREAARVKEVQSRRREAEARARAELERRRSKARRQAERRAAAESKKRRAAAEAKIRIEEQTRAKEQEKRRQTAERKRKEEARQKALDAARKKIEARNAKVQRARRELEARRRKTERAKQQTTAGQGAGAREQQAAVLSTPSLRSVIVGTRFYFNRRIVTDEAFLVDFTANGRMTGALQYTSPYEQGAVQVHESDRGTWSANGNNLCMTWGKWDDGKRICYVIKGAGKKYVASGAKGILTGNFTIAR